jgi:hypothetical protein
MHIRRAGRKATCSRRAVRRAAQWLSTGRCVETRPHLFRKKRRRSAGSAPRGHEPALITYKQNRPMAGGNFCLIDKVEQGVLAEDRRFVESRLFASVTFDQQLRCELQQQEQRQERQQQMRPVLGDWQAHELGNPAGEDQQRRQ